MSWDSYIDNLIGHSGDNCDRACIIGLDGGAPWTSNTHAKAIQVQSQEGADIARAMKGKDSSAFATGGIRLEGIKYQFLREEDQVKTVLGKKKENGAITLQSSKTAIVIGHTAEGKQQGEVNKAVAIIAEYLESLNM